MPQFEVFRKRMAPVVKDPYITIQKKGIISLNRAAYDALGEPQAVELLYDQSERLIGIRKADPETTPHAYGLRAVAQRESSFLLSGTAFTKYYGIDTSRTFRYPAKMDADILCVDLNGPKDEIVGNRKPSKAKTEEPDEAAASNVSPLGLPDIVTGRRAEG